MKRITWITDDKARQAGMPETLTNGEITTSSQSLLKSGRFGRAA